MNESSSQNNGIQQRGYILLVVLLFLAMLLTAGAHFFLKSTEHTKETGGVRDMTESLLLAESAINFVLGQYWSGAGGDFNETENLAAFMNDQANLADILSDIPNLFYITDTGAAGELNQVKANLLQIVADGEANNVNPTSLSSARLETSTASPLTRLRINDLFDPSANFRPKLFVLNATTGLLTPSVALNWNAEVSPVKVAVWFEAIQSPLAASSAEIYVQAVAEVDGARSYVQRVLDGFDSGNTLGSSVSALVGSSTTATTGGIDRRRSVD